MAIDDNEEVQQPEEETTPPPAPEPKIFPSDKEPVGPVDVDLADEEGAPTPVAEEEAPKPEPKKEDRKQAHGHARTTPSQRIGQMRAQLGAAEKALAERDARLAQLEQQNRELAAWGQHVDAAAFDSHAARIQSERAAAKQAFKNAKERGDVDAEAEAAERMSGAASELQAINAYKAQFPDQFNPDGSRRQVPQQRQQEQPRPQPRQQPQPQPQMQPPPELQDWLEENPWVDPSSPGHNPEMAQSATQFASILDARYNRAGRTEDIGRADYLQDLNNMLQQEYPEAYQDEAAPPPLTRRPTMTRPNGAGVAPASRQAPTPAPGQPGSNTVRMSAEEHDFAMKMIRNGAYRYPKGHPKEFQKITDLKDGMRHHAEFVQKDRDLEPMRRKS